MPKEKQVEEVVEEAKPEGMLFSVKSEADNKYGGAPVGRACFYNVLVDGRPLIVKGSTRISDPYIVSELLKNPGTLHFDPQEAVDKGILPASKVKELGYDVK